MVVMYFILHSLRMMKIELPEFINSYLTDLICMPIVLMICLFFARWFKKNNLLVIHPFMIGLLCVEYIFVFEYFLPKKSIHYTADWFDALLYIIGSVAFYFMQKKLMPKNFEFAPNN